MSKPARFSQADATRAMRAALAAGLKPSECTIDRDGIIRLVFTDVAVANSGNPLDRVLSR